MKLSRTVTYAVSASMQLARQQTGAPVPCSKLAAEGAMPERFLLQILRNLVRHDVLRSTRGVEGGYSLARSPQEISVLEIIEAVEGPLEISQEPTAATAEEQDSGAESQNLQLAIAHIAKRLKLQMDAIKLSHLLEPPE